MQRLSSGCVIGEEARPDSRLDDVVADHGCGDRHDHHPKQRHAVANERAIEQRIHQDRDHSPAERGDDHREPDVHA